MVCNEWVVFQGLQLRKMRYEQRLPMVDSAVVVLPLMVVFVVDSAVVVLLLMVVYGNAENAGGSPARDFSP